MQRSYEYGSPHYESPPPVQSKPHRIFVGRLPLYFKESHLMEHFNKLAKIKSVTIKRKKNGTSKGYGFINCEDYSSYECILSQPHIIQGRKLDVNCANSPLNTSKLNLSPIERRKFFIRFQQDKIIPSQTELINHFQQFGEVVQAFVIDRSHNTTSGKPIGYVEFQRSKGAIKCERASLKQTIGNQEIIL